MKPEDTTGLKCLQLLFGQFRHTVNFPALMTQKVLDQYREDPAAELMRLSADQELLPERIASADVFKSYAGPGLFRLKTGNWVLVLNCRQLTSGESTTIVDPAAGPQSINVQTRELQARWDGTGIIFRNLMPVDSRRQTRLTSFVAIARNDSTHLDIREIMHEYAVGEDEVRESLFREIAADYHYKVRKVRLSWKELQKSSSVFPCIALKKKRQIGRILRIPDHAGRRGPVRGRRSGIGPVQFAQPFPLLHRKAVHRRIQRKIPADEKSLFAFG